MKQIMEDYSPILEGLEVEELKEKVLQKPEKFSKKESGPSDQNSLHLKNATPGKDVPVGK